jgi:hypothetical protein
VSLRSSAALAISCDQIPNATNPDAGALPPVLYIEGANAIANFLVPLQQALSVDPNPINLVYIGDGGCVGAGNFFTGKPIGSKPKPVYFAGQVQATCDLPLTGGPNNGPPVADIAASDVYAPTCGTLPGGQLPQFVGDFLGPIQPVMFVVPKSSTQDAISASAAYFVFGFGSDSGVAPWTTSSSIYRRNATSATQALLAVGIGVPLARWAGVDASSLPANAGLPGANAIINSLETDHDPEAAIGILASPNLDPAASTHLKVLAYKDAEQSCAYYPDSTSTAHDKANVRDGHYSPWGPIHFFAYIDSRGFPSNQNVARVISYLTGTSVPPGGVDLVQVDAQNGLVPSCAMRVARTAEMGPLMSYAPAASCSCYYDYVATGASTCKPCSKAADCPSSAPVCNVSYAVGFCETQ